MKTVRAINWIFFASSLCSLLAIPILGIGSAMQNWQGICYGFTDSQAPCTWWEFARNEMFWNSFLFIPLLAITITAWLIMNVVQWIIRKYPGTNSTKIK